MNLKERYLRINTLYESEKKRFGKLDNEVALLENDFDVKTQALVVLDFLVEEEIKEGVNSYVSLLEEGLSAIFPEQTIKQQAEITKIRNKIAVRLKTVIVGDDGIEVEGEGLETFGGAISTVQSLLLRICLILKKGLRPLLILDETFPAVDESRIDLLVAFLKSLCERLEMDILCITHNSLLAENAENAYQIYSTKEGAKFRKV